MTKLIPAGAVIAGALSRSPTTLMLIVAVVAVIVVLATYLLIARREIAPKVRWGNLSIDFTRIPEDEEQDPPDQNS